MSDNKDETIEDAVVVDEATATPVVVEEAAPSETEPVVATADPAAVETEVPAYEPVADQRVVYVQMPSAPKKHGNRGIGSLVALAATVVFTAVYALIAALITSSGGRLSFAFLTRPEFYIPALFFAIGFILLVLILNRANWWAYIIGSLLLGLFVYFGSIGLTLLSTGIIQETPEAAAQLFRGALTSPSFIIAALLAREVALWSGALIARRGRRLRARNLETRAAYERELAERRGEQSAAAAV